MKRTMTRIILVLLVAAMALGMVACGESTNNKTTGVDFSQYPAKFEDWTMGNLKAYLRETGIITNDSWVIDGNYTRLERNRRLEEANIMASANQKVMMYSNFPQRVKMQYLTSNYLPAMVEARNTYQTGLDKLRSNAVSVANEIKSIEDAIADLNKT